VRERQSYLKMIRKLIIKCTRRLVTMLEEHSKEYIEC